MDCLRVKEELGGLIAGEIRVEEPMANHTTWRIGGPADILVSPAEQADVETIVRYAGEKKIPLTVIGNGSNILVRDRGIRGIVLKITRGLNKVDVNGLTIRAGAGAFLPVLAKKAAEHGLTGLEFAAGIPGTVGGAVAMNAGANGQSISDVVQEVKAITPEGSSRVITGPDLKFRYRGSVLLTEPMVIVEVLMALQKGEREDVCRRMEELLARRKAAQPLDIPNAGSVFTNPPGLAAGRLIEEAGGKGMQAGNARVSEKHANFIVNTGGATASDVTELIKQVQELVYQKHRIQLQMEVRVLGE